MTVPTKQEFFSELIRNDCPICYEKIIGLVKTSCGHLFCAECAKTWFETSHTCPSCRKVLYEQEGMVDEDGDEVVRFELEEEDDDATSYSGAEEEILDLRGASSRANEYFLRSASNYERAAEDPDGAANSSGRTLASDTFGPPAAASISEQPPTLTRHPQATSSFQWPSAFDYSSESTSDASTQDNSTTSLFSSPALGTSRESPEQTSSAPPIFRDISVTTAWPAHRRIRISTASVHVMSQPTFTQARELSADKFLSRLQQYQMLVNLADPIMLDGYEVRDQLTFERVIESAMEAAIQWQIPADTGQFTISLECRVVMLGRGSTRALLRA